MLGSIPFARVVQRCPPRLVVWRWAYLVSLAARLALSKFLFEFIHIRKPRWWRRSLASRSESKRGLGWRRGWWGRGGDRVPGGGRYNVSGSGLRHILRSRLVDCGNSRLDCCRVRLFHSLPLIQCLFPCGDCRGVCCSWHHVCRRYNCSGGLCRIVCNNCRGGARRCCLHSRICSLFCNLVWCFTLICRMLSYCRGRCTARLFHVSTRPANGICSLCRNSTGWCARWHPCGSNSGGILNICWRTGTRSTCCSGSTCTRPLFVNVCMKSICHLCVQWWNLGRIVAISQISIDICFHILLEFVICICICRNICKTLTTCEPI